VVASDLTPELLKSGRRQATKRGLEVEWRQAVMFRPLHQASADELVRVCSEPV
jgi:hypothetical protein